MIQKTYPNRIKFPLVLALAAALLTGCSSARQQQPGPAFMEPSLHDDYVAFADGYRTPLSRWLPDARARGVVLALHGYNDYRRAFEGVGRRLAARGFATYAYDQRGFGGAPFRGIWPGWRQLADDAATVVGLLAAAHPGRPVFILGESMGGAVGMVTAAEHALPELSGLALVAPAVWGRETMGLGTRLALWAGVNAAPSRVWTGEGLDIRPSDNTQMLRAMARDPRVIKGSRTDALWGMTNLMDAALAAAPEVTHPLLILYGGKDEIIPKGPTCRMLRRLPDAAPWRVAIYLDGYHMLLRDLDPRAQLSDLAAWLDNPRSPVPPDHVAAGSPDWRQALCPRPPGDGFLTGDGSRAMP